MRIPRDARRIKGNFWIWLPPRRFAPPLLFQEGSRNFKLRPPPEMPPLRGSMRMRPYPCGDPQISRMLILDRCACAEEGTFPSSTNSMHSFYDPTDVIRIPVRFHTGRTPQHDSQAAGAGLASAVIPRRPFPGP